MGPSRLLRFSLALVLCLSLATPFLSTPKSRAEAPPQGWTAGSEGWVWQNPVPQGNPVYDIVASDPSHVWLVGDEIMSFDGSSWQRNVGYPANAKAAAALDSSHIWAVGTDIYFYDGSSWHQQAAPANFYANNIFALDAQHVWAVGSGVYFFDGTAWSTQTTSIGGDAVWAADANHVWVTQNVPLGCHQMYCGYEEFIYFFDGSNWTAQYSYYPDAEGLKAISGSAGNDVWAVGGNNVLRYNGSSWTQDTSDYFFRDIKVYDSSHIWATTGTQILFNNGTEWFIEMGGLEAANELAVPAADRVWVKDIDLAWFYNGTGWTSYRFVSDFRPDWVGIAMGDARHLWAITDEEVFASNGGAWVSQQLPYTDRPRGLKSVFALDPDHVWVVSNQGDFLYLNGGNWTWGPPLYTTPGAAVPVGYRDIAATDPQHIWACGSGGIYFFDGSSWTLQLAGEAFAQTNPVIMALYAADPQHVWAVAQDMRIFFFDGQSWNVQFQTNGMGFAADIGGFGLSRIWVIFGGSPQSLLFYDGTSWEYEDGPTLDIMGGKLAVGPNLAMAATSGGGGILENDGSGWRLMDAGTQLALGGIAMSDSGHAWVVGRSGVVLSHISSPPNPPSGFSNLRWLAEGYTGGGFDEWLCLGNPGGAEASVQVLYSFSDRGWETQDLKVAGNSRTTIGVNTAVGKNKQVAARIASDQPLVVERPMYFDYMGIWSGGHTVTATISPSKTWYFAEGNTLAGFNEFICVENTQTTNADLMFTFQSQESGEIRLSGGIVPAGSRYTFKVNDFIGSGLQVSLKIESTEPVIAERAMYFDYGGWTGGSCVMGATSLSNEYYFAEGSTRNGFAEYLTLQNPNPSPITVEAVYQLGEGQGDPVTRSYMVEGNRRATVYVPSEVGPGRDVSVKLSSSSSFLAERPMYFDYTGYGADWTGGHCVIGAAAPAAEWFFAEGCTLPGFHEYLCLQNPGDTDSTVEITYLTQEAGALPAQTTVVPAHSRVTSLVNVAAGEGYQLSCRVRVVSGTGIVAERPMYFDYGGWNGGHCAVGYAP